MNSQQKFVNILSICRKGDMLVVGFDAVKDAVQEGKASCVAVTKDISDKTLKEVRFFCANCHVDVIDIELKSYDMFDAIGKKTVVAAISNHGMAQKLKEVGRVIMPPTKRRSRAERLKNPDDK